MDLIDFVPRKSTRATKRAKRALVLEVRRAFSRLDVRVSDNNSLATAVGGERARLEEIGQQAGGDAGAAEA